MKNVFIEHGTTLKERMPIQSGSEESYVTQSVMHPGNCDITQFRLGLVELEPGQVLGEHKHNCDEIMYVLDGQGSFGVDGVEYPCGVGDGVFVGPDVVHGGHHNTGNTTWRYLYVTGQKMAPLTSVDVTLPDGTPIIPRKVE